MPSPIARRVGELVDVMTGGLELRMLPPHLADGDLQTVQPGEVGALREHRTGAHVLEPPPADHAERDVRSFCQSRWRRCVLRVGHGRTGLS